MPVLTLPSSPKLAGEARTAGKLGLIIPIRTGPSSLIWEVEVFTTTFTDIFCIEPSNS
jgi:hypothetical protein